MGEETEAWSTLCVQPGQLIDHEVKVGGIAYKFKLKVLSWPEVAKLRSDHTLIDRQTRRTVIDDSGYQFELLKLVIAEGPFEPSRKEEFIRSMKMDVQESIINRETQLHSLPQEVIKN